MQDQIEFIDGLFAKAPHPNAPDFIKANISIKREEMLNWLSAAERGWGRRTSPPETTRD